jgi:hypothetical protein
MTLSTKEAESGVVGGDTAVSVPQAYDDAAVQQRPGRVAVEQQQGLSAALVEKVDMRARDIRIMARERIQIRRKPRWAVTIGHASQTTGRSDIRAACVRRPISLLACRSRIAGSTPDLPGS